MSKLLYQRIFAHNYNQWSCVEKDMLVLAADHKLVNTLLSYLKFAVLKTLRLGIVFYNQVMSKKV